MQVLNERIPSELEDLDLDKVLKPNYLGFISKAAQLPLRTLELVRSLARLGEFSAIDLGVGLAEALPSGLYSGDGIDDYIAGVLKDSNRLQPTSAATTVRIAAGKQLELATPITFPDG